MATYCKKVEAKKSKTKEMKTQTVYIDKLKKEIEFMIGENAKDNFSVIDQGSAEDYWFHIQHESSCHVVAVVPAGLDRKGKGYIIRKGAEICKNHSRFRSMNRVEIVYTKIKNVTKTDVPGQVNIVDTKIIVV